MNEKPVPVKSPGDRRTHPKDWNRRARVIAALAEKEMSLKDLAEELDVSQGYISAIVWGTRRLHSAEANIAIVLGKSCDELFGASQKERSVA
jgi:lambda repressor-like predicted transcriptional regulator